MLTDGLREHLAAIRKKRLLEQRRKQDQSDSDSDDDSDSGSGSSSSSSSSSGSGSSSGSDSDSGSDSSSSDTDSSEDDAEKKIPKKPQIEKVAALPPEQIHTPPLPPEVDPPKEPSPVEDQRKSSSKISIPEQCLDVVRPANLPSTTTVSGKRFFEI